MQDFPILLPTSLDVPLRVSQDGNIRVGPTRVTFTTIVESYRGGEMPEQIHEGFPTVPLAHIYAVIAFYLANREVLDAYIDELNKAADRLRQEHEANDPTAAVFYARMRALLAERRNQQSES